MSAGLTAAGGLFQGVSQYEAGQEKGSLFRANAGIAAQQFQSEVQAGSENEERVLMKGAQQTGQQVAQIGASNLQQRGTPAQVVASSAVANEMDALTTINNARRRAYGFQVQEVSDQKQASLAREAGDFNAAGSILAGGAKAYDQEQKAGGWF
jgi:DNA helicase TIP49 (TBP-interacting protein)